MENQRDVIVVDGEGFDNRAIFGDIMGSVALSKGIVGVVVNGSIRDVKVLKALVLPVFYKHISLNGPIQHGPGKIMFPSVLTMKSFIHEIILWAIMMVLSVSDPMK